MKIRYKALMQAIQFACLPTISLLLLLFFGFFSIEKTISFITSDNGWAIAIRLIALLGEFGLIWYLYKEYADKEIILEKEAHIQSQVNNKQELDYKTRSYSTELHYLHTRWSSGDKYFSTLIDDNHVLIKHEARKD